MEVIVNLEGLIDVSAERKRLEKELERLEQSVRVKRAKLANEKFVANAPAEIVERERAGLAGVEEQLASLEAALAALPQGQ
jgi:valyl-tRNA synthetase